MGPLDLTFAMPAWQEPPKPVQSVNELEDPGGLVGAFWPKQGLSVCERWLTVWKWCCSTHAGTGLCHCDVAVVECRGSHGVLVGVVEAVL